MVKQRLLKSSLLRKGWEYDEVYSNGRRLHGKGFTLICVQNSLAGSRLGISLHHKIKGAVKRNRLKRIIRESFRLWRDKYPVGCDIVFTIRPDFVYSHPEHIVAAVEPLSSQLAGTHKI